MNEFPGNKNLSNKIVFLFIIFNLISVFTLTYYSYNVSKILIFKDTDDRLISGAFGVSLALGDNFHDEIKDKNSISESRHDANAAKLGEIASKYGVDYLYSMMKNSGEIVFTSLSANSEEIKNKSYDKFFTLYKTPSEMLLDVYDKSGYFFEEFEDEYGYFRSVIIPMKSKGGKHYIAGADIAISNITARVNAILLNHLIAGFFVFLLTSLIAVFILKKFLAKVIK